MHCLLRVFSSKKNIADISFRRKNCKYEYQTLHIIARITGKVILGKN